MTFLPSRVREIAAGAPDEGFFFEANQQPTEVALEEQALRRLSATTSDMDPLVRSAELVLQERIPRRANWSCCGRPCSRCCPWEGA